MPNVLNCIHFVKARSNLILSCSSEGFPIYASVGREGEKKKEIEEREENSSGHFFF